MKNQSVKEYYDILNRRKISIVLKRVFDIVLSVILIVLLSWLMLIIAAAIAADSRGGVFFLQERVTTYGKKFRIIKFRTMVKNAEELGSKLTVSNDMRVTHTGLVLRKFHLDEIPQLFNIFVGQMSFVGTRPEVSKYVDGYTDEMKATLLLPAGLTSMASIMYKDEYQLITDAENPDEIYINQILPSKMRYNLDALKKFSIFSDIGIMFKTIVSVFIRSDDDFPAVHQKRALIIVEDARSLILTRKELISALLDCEYAIDVLTPYDKNCEQLENMGCSVTGAVLDRRGKNPLKDLKLYSTYKRLIRRDYDLGITYSIKPNIYGGTAMKKKKIPYYINVTGLGTAFNNGGILRQVIKLMYMPVTRRAKGVLFENSSDAEAFIRMKLCKPNQAHVMNGAGINTAEYEYCDYPADGTVNFLYIGRLMEEKGIEELYYSAKKLSYSKIDAEFSFVGDFEDAYSEKYEKFRKLNNVKYYGYQDDVKPFIGKCNCLILPSHHEGMANVLLEAAALGRPLIASDIPGCREAIEVGKNGYVFNVGDEKDIYDKIVQFINLPYEEKRRMGQYSRKLVKAYFERDDVVNSVLKVIGVKKSVGKGRAEKSKTRGETTA